MSSKEGQREKERGSTVKGSGTKGDDSLGKRSKSTGAMKGDKSDKAEPGTTEPSPLERKSSSKKKRSFFKRSRSSSGTRSSSKAIVNGGGGDDDDDGGGADAEFRGGGGAEGAEMAGLGGHRAVVSDDEGSVQVSRPRDRLRRMTVKEARMEKRVKWMSSANALPSRSQRRQRASAKGVYDDYDAMDDDDDDFEDTASIRALSVSTPDLHRDDDDDFDQIESLARSPMRSTTKEMRRPEKLHKIIKSTSPSRGKESKSSRSSSSKAEGGHSNQKGDPVRYIRVGRDIKHTEKKVPSSPSTSRHAKRSPSGSRSPTTKARGLSKDRHRQSRSKSPKRTDSRTRTPQVVRSLSASNETLKTKKLKDRRTKSMEKASRRTRDQDQARTGKPSPLSPRAAAKRSENRRAHRDREYQDSDDSDINEPHTLFMELSKTASPYSSGAARKETQNELALNKYNLLKRSSSNLLQLVKDSEADALPMADAGKMQSLSVAKDGHQRSISPRGRSSHSGKEEARHHRSRHSESREKSSGGRGGSQEPRSSSRRANNSEEPLSPTIPDGSVFYDDDNVSPVSPTFPSSSSQKYTRTFSPTRHTLRDWKRTGSRADDDDDDDDDDNNDVCIDIETSDLESDPTAGKPYISEKSPLRSTRYEVPSGHSSSVPARYGSRSPEKTVQSPTIKVSKPDFDNASAGHKAPSPTKSRDINHSPSKSNTASFIPSPSTKSSHTASIPTVGVPTEISKDPLSRSGSAKSHTPVSTIDPTRLTITIPQRFSTDDDESVSPMSLNSHSRSLSSKSPSKSPALSPVSASQKSSSVSTDGSSTAALSQPSTSRSPSPNTASNVFNEPHPHTGVSGGSTWFDKIHEMKIGSRRPAAGANEGHKMFFPEIDVKRTRVVEALQRNAADTKGKKKNVKVQRSFSERDASKRPAPRVPEILVKTDSMQKITRISAENIRRFGEVDPSDNTEKMLTRGGRSSSGFMGMRRKGDKLTSSESALEKAGEKQSLFEAKKEIEESKKEKSKTKRWSLKGKSKDKAMEKKKELEKKKSKKEKKSSKKVKKSDSVNSNKDDQGGPHASTQTVLLGEHLAGIKLDVEANFEEDGGVRKTDKSGSSGLSLSAVVLLKNRLARQRRLRIGFDLENDDMDSVTEFRELNLLNQLVRQPLDTPLSLENETNLFKPLDIRETALVDDDPTQTGGMYEKIDATKQLKEDDPNYQAKRAEMRRESKAFRMRERRRKILSCIKKFIAFLFSHIGLCSLVVAYSIMGGFVFKAIEGPFEEESRAMNITEYRKVTVSEINKLSNDLKQGRASSKDFMSKLDEKLKKFQLTVHNATKNEVYMEDADERDLKWSYASSLLYAITVMTTIGYGHVAPKTPYGRIVTIFYAVLGIPLTLLCLTNIGNLMADGFRILYGKICCGLCCLLFKPRRYGRRRRKHLHDPEFCNCEVTERKVEKSNEVVQVPTSLCILLIAAYIFAGALLFSLWEKWDYLTGSYFCFITLSTIGFGDIVPGTDIKSWSQQEKLVLCALYLVIGLSLIAMCFNLVQEDVKAKCRWLGRKFGIIDKDDTSIN